MGYIEHAEEEMRRAGLYDKDADYGGMIPEAVMELVKVHSKQGHSGGSHAITLEIFNRVINFKTLTPITDNAKEWRYISEMSHGNPMWQNMRDSSCFSTDGGKTYYSVNDEKREIKNSQHH